MNTAKVYQDNDGNDCSIVQMVSREPQWAAVRVQEGEKAIDRVKQLEQAIRVALEQQPYMATRVSTVCAELRRALKGANKSPEPGEEKA